MFAATTVITDFVMRNQSGQMTCYKTGQFYLLLTDWEPADWEPAVEGHKAPSCVAGGAFGPAGPTDREFWVRNRARPTAQRLTGRAVAPCVVVELTEPVADAEAGNLIVSTPMVGGVSDGEHRKLKLRFVKYFAVATIINSTRLTS